MIVLFLIMVYSYKLVLVIKHYIAPVLYAKLVFFLHNSPIKLDILGEIADLYGKCHSFVR